MYISYIYINIWLIQIEKNVHLFKSKRPNKPPENVVAAFVSRIVRRRPRKHTCLMIKM